MSKWSYNEVVCISNSEFEIVDMEPIAQNINTTTFGNNGEFCQNRVINYLNMFGENLNNIGIVTFVLASSPFNDNIHKVRTDIFKIYFWALKT